MSQTSGTVLRTDGVDVVLGGRRILMDVDLTVRPGEVVALLGANGSGKSTLVRAALGVIPVAKGQVRLFDQPLRTAPWHRVGYVPQRMPASTGVPTTACEVVRAGLLSRRRLRPGSRAQAIAALDAMGMAHRANHPVQEMSGGQQQRVLIARALVREPDLLVLDEPTTGIDLDTISTFVATIDRMRRAGTTVVVVLHETEAFASMLDRAVVLRHGRVVHDGPPPPARAEHAGPQHEHAHPHAEPPRDDGLLDLEVIGGDG
ncbi:metal ABC transporter ATP-binding protein [Actinotalea sp. M2MS4P-6]|uniref:metal ABC transporter ATP-binding protein n=1 Tax=Actinotalea sp. M2MS4P-6 TaxID=2983762 RepID=UPI0021E416B9|nr:metal ABC transporter ATP-binding protein [Actinotalea sp. M2MS4P-6]MCV2393912.1 metal ABC transporter ATP-binding protein [Actinotalea sp. M2MS4P-6]